MKAIILVALFAAAVAQQSKAQYINDNHVLNYALTLENLESQFYAQGLAKFNSDSAFTSAGYPTGTYNLLNFIAGQEAGHAAALTAVLNSRAWPAVTTCTYDFSAAYVDVPTFMKYITIVEGTGTAAYDGASIALTDAALLTVAAGIATIEARHTSAVQILFNNTAGSSWPGAYEIPLNEAAVFAAVKGFFVNCTAATANVPYNGPTSVISSDPTTYTWQPAVTLRGGASISDNNFYYSNAALATADLSILQYALYLENLENNFYATFNLSYTQAAILNDSNYATYYNAANASIVSNSIQAIAAHESAHAAFLTTVISGYKATPAAACTAYNWTVFGLPNNPTATSPTFTQFLQVAQTLENTGVHAYVGAIGLISNSITAGIAATIATIEARHAAYIVSILNKNPPYFGPNAFPTDNVGGGAQGDLPVNPATTYNLIAAALGNCSNANPSPAPYLGSNSLAFNFFSDKTGAQPASLAATTSSSSSNPASTTSSPSSSASCIAVSFAVLAFIVALF